MDVTNVSGAPLEVMKDLHIVIVSWNVQAELERCLKSLSEACEGLDWECVVVDNNSTDDSVLMVQKIFADHDHIDLLKNDKNLGFAAACNQGAVQHKSRYILLLNPDTVCPPQSLTELVRKMDLNPKAGIMGPKLLNIDGTYQPSVRRFPSLLDQVLILLKLHHFFPRLKSLQRYFASDINPNRPLSVEQVMGACFLVRADCWNQMRGLDQRYFIWFEEVDACKTAKQNRWLVWYEPSVAIMHYGGQSFGKAFTLRKQKYFNDSLLKYMLKWHGRRDWLIIVLLYPFSLVLAGLVSIVKTPLRLAIFNSKKLTELERIRQAENFAGSNSDSIYRDKIQEPKSKKIIHVNKINISRHIGLHDIYFALGFIMSIELLSVFTIHSNITRSFIAVLIGLFIGLLAYKNPAKALAVIIIELLIGGFGYLFTISTVGSEMGISLRMVLMAGFGLGWMINAFKAQIWRFWRVKELLIVQIWLFVAVMLLIGLVNGMLLKQPYIFQDANAWLFLLYFVPVMDVAHRYKNDFIRYSKAAIIASLIYLPLKALAVLYIFSHGIIFLTEPLYAWIRDTRVGEITPAGGNVFRVFFQSAIYSIFAALFVLAYWMRDLIINLQEAENSTKQQANQQPARKSNIIKRYADSLLWIISICMIVISLSRSFWMGLVAGGLSILILGVLAHKKMVWRSMLKAILGSVAAVIVIGGVIYFPLPATKDISFASMIKDRGNLADAAGSSRWNLLPAMWQKIGESPILGHGFGSTITYKSQDPRVLQNNPDGIYTTYAFEWGWLAFWVKFGIFGPLVMLVLLISLGWRSWKSDYDWWLRAGMVGSLIALATVHIFTPYLDHPLGFATLLAIEAFLAMSRET